MSADNVKNVNSALIECMNFATSSCNLDLSDFHREITAIESYYLRGWSIPFEKRCSNSSRSSISSYFSESSESDADVMTAVNQLSLTSSQKIASVAQFADDLNTYNFEYVSNKTTAIQGAATRIQGEMQQLSAEAVTEVQAVMNSIIAATEQLIVCIGLDNATKTRGGCPHGLGMYDRIRDLQIAMKVQTLIFEGYIDDYKKEFESFAADVKDAIKAADSFYDSVAGATGLISWIVGNLNIFRVASELCGKGSPNWCDFSKASWYVWTPDMPADISSLLVDFPNPHVLWDPYLAELTAFRNAFDLNVTVLEAIPKSLLAQLDLKVQKIPELNFSVTNLGPEDYHPPKYSNYVSSKDPLSSQENVSDSESVLTRSSRNYDGFRLNITKSIEARLAQSSQLLDVWNATDIISSDPYLEKIVDSISGKAIQLSEFHFSAATFSFPSVEPDLVFGRLSSFLEILYLFDNLYRIWLSLRIVYLYWKNAAISVSPIDVSDVDSTFVEIQNSTACQYELHKSISRSLTKNMDGYQNRMVYSPEARLQLSAIESSKSHRRNLAVEACIRPKPFFSTPRGDTNCNAQSSYGSPSGECSVRNTRTASDVKQAKANDQTSSYSWGNTSLTVWKLVLYFVSHFWVQIGIAIGFVCIVGYTVYGKHIFLI
jgi:hypothetical protein